MSFAITHPLGGRVTSRVYSDEQRRDASTRSLAKLFGIAGDVRIPVTAVTLLTRLIRKLWRVSFPG